MLCQMFSEIGQQRKKIIIKKDNEDEIQPLRIIDEIQQQNNVDEKVDEKVTKKIIIKIKK